MMPTSSTGRFWPVVLLLVAAAWSEKPVVGQSDPGLDHVLDVMDKAGTNFRTTEAAFVWQQYTSLVKETDTQKGKIYFRRSNHEIQMAVDITDPYPKYVLLSGGKLQLFEPRVDRVTVYNVQKNQAEFEAFLQLGFGGGGHSMLKSFDIKYLGTEKVNGLETSKLDLVPKSAKIRNTFEHIVLWIDLDRGISVQQQLFQPGGDYRLASYSDIEINQKIPDSVFKLKTGAKTTIQSVAPHD
jgi:outer membrane lipoprotein-sorting protein